MIDGWIVKQDSVGRYCLNDLHKAAGGLNKDKPSHWLQLPAPYELANALIACGQAISPLEAKAGRYGGTYAVKELVYAYAMWRSRKRHAEYHPRAIDLLPSAIDLGRVCYGYKGVV